MKHIKYFKNYKLNENENNINKKDDIEFINNYFDIKSIQKYISEIIELAFSSMMIEIPGDIIDENLQDKLNEIITSDWDEIPKINNEINIIFKSIKKENLSLVFNYPPYRYKNEIYNIAEIQNFISMDILDYIEEIYSKYDIEIEDSSDIIKDIEYIKECDWDEIPETIDDIKQYLLNEIIKDI